MLPALLEQTDHPLAAKVAVAESGRMDHMSRTYIRLEPRLLPGGATIDTRLSRGRWRRHLLLVSSDSVEVRNLGSSGNISLTGWDAWDDVVLVLSNVDVVGIGYDYEVIVEYDPLGDPYARLQSSNFPIVDQIVNSRNSLVANMTVSHVAGEIEFFRSGA